MRITLNLATRPFADLGPAVKRLRIAMGVLAAVSIGLGVGLHLVHDQAERARARDHSLDGQIAHITRERQSYTALMQQPPNARLLVEAGMLNQLFDEKTFSWTLAIEDLETVLPGGVQASSLEPVRAKDGQITLHLRVIGPRDREDELVNNLEHSKRFLMPRIVSENAETKEGANQEMQPVSASNPFNFDLLAEYNPATAGELAEAEKHQARAERAENKRAGASAPKANSVRNHPGTPMPQSAVPPGFARPGRPPYAAPRPGVPARVRPGQNPGGPQ
jgi:type IV pilus assembly protein PilN